MKKTKALIQAILLSVISYTWVWLATWWGFHLASDAWISFPQIVTIIAISGGLYAATLVSWFRYSEVKDA